MTRVLEAFAGCGGQALGWHRAGVEHVGLVERDEYAAAVLRRHFPGVPVLSDALALDPAEWRGRVDVLTGGPPCQSASHAGLRKGRADERWLWGWFVDFAAAIEAPLVVAENPPGLFSVENGEGFASILHAFGDHGYAVEWDTLAAGTLSAFYVTAVAESAEGCRPLGLPGHYGEDAEHLSAYAAASRDDVAFAAYLDKHLPHVEAA